MAANVFLPAWELTALPKFLARFEGPLRGGGKRGEMVLEGRGKGKEERDGRNGRKHPEINNFWLRP